MRYLKPIQNINDILLNDFSIKFDPESITGYFLLKLFLCTLVTTLVAICLLIMFIPICILFIFNYLMSPLLTYYDKITKRRIGEIVREILDKHSIEVLEEGLLNIKPITPLGHNSIYLGEFIYEFIRNYNNNYYTKNQYGLVTCEKAKRRSLGDIFRLCKTYYPDCTIHDVINELVWLLENGMIKGSYCTTIYKYVFHLNGNVYSRNDEVEYSSKIKFNDIIKTYKT